MERLQTTPKQAGRVAGKEERGRGRRSPNSNRKEIRGRWQGGRCGGLAVRGCKGMKPREIRPLVSTPKYQGTAMIQHTG